MSMITPRIASFLKFFGLLLAVTVVISAGIYCFENYVPGKVKISRNISDGDFRIDGKNETFKDTFWLRPGAHSFELRKSGYLSVEISVEITPLRTQNINLRLYKITDLSTNDLVNSSALVQVDTAGSDLPYLDEDQKAVFKLSNDKASKLLDLPFLQNEQINKYHWSSDRSQLFIQTLSGDNFSNRLIAVVSGSILTLDPGILDMAFSSDQYYTLQSKDNGVSVSGKSGQIVFINQAANNLVYDGNDFLVYNDISGENSRDVFFCQTSCKKANLPADIIQIYAAGGKALAILLTDNYQLYSIADGQVKLIDRNIEPFISISKDSRTVIYLTKEASCQVKEYDFSVAKSIYQNSNICSAGDITKADNKLYIMQGSTAYYLELK